MKKTKSNIKKQKTRAQIIQWLKDNDLYRTIQRKLVVPIERHPSSDNDLGDFIISAFSWKRSPEGLEYWQKVNRRFEEWFNGDE